MKTFLKALLIFVSLVVMLLAILPIVFKDKLIALAKEEADKNLNAVVRFDDASLSLLRSFPNLDLRVYDLSIANKAPFEGDTLLKAGTLGIKLNLWEVLSGTDITVRSIYARDLDLLAKVDSAGNTNWDITLATEEVKEADTTAPSEEPFKFSLDKYRIEEGRLRYLDVPGNMTFEMKGINHEGLLVLDGPITHMKTSTQSSEMTYVYEGIAYLNRVTAEAEVNFDYDLDRSFMTLTENEVKLNDLLMKAAGTIDMGDSTKMGFDLKFETPQSDFKSIISLIPAVYYTDFESVKTSGTFTFSGALGGFYGPGEDDYPSMDFGLTISNGMMSYPDLPAAMERVNATMSLKKPQGSLDAMVLSIKPFSMQLAGSSITMGLGLTHPMTDPVIDLMVIGKADLAKVSKALPGLEMDLTGRATADLVLAGASSDLEAARTDKITARGLFTLAGFSYQAEGMPTTALDTLALNLTPAYAYVPELKGTAGKTDFAASGRVDNLSSWLLNDSTLVGRFQVSSNLLDLNEWMPAEEEAPAAETPDSSAAMTAVEVPGGLDLRLDFNAARVNYTDLVLEDVGGAMTVKNHRVAVADFGLLIEKQRLVMNGFYEKKPEQSPLANFSFSAPSLDVKTLYKSFGAVQKYAPLLGDAEGTVGLNMKLETRLGADMAPDMATLMADGVLKTKELVIRSEALKGLADAVKNSDFAQIRPENTDLSFKVRDGRLIVSPVKAKVGGHTATFEGNNGLDGSLDYVLSSKLPLSAIPGANALQNLGVPTSGEADIKVLIGGNFKKPTYKLQMGNVAGGVKDQLIDQGKQEVQKVLDEAVKAARAQGDALIAEAQKQADALVVEAEKSAAQIRAEGKRQAENIIKEAQKQVERLKAEAGGNPLKLMAAEKAGEKVMDEARKQAAKVETAANNQADKVVNEARKKGDEGVALARKQADELVASAEEKAKLK